MVLAWGVEPCCQELLKNRLMSSASLQVREESRSLLWAPVLPAGLGVTEAWVSGLWPVLRVSHWSMGESVRASVELPLPSFSSFGSLSLTF